MEFSVPVTVEVAFEPSGVSVVELSVPVTAEVALCPSGVMLVEFKVPVTAELFIVPVTALVPSVGGFTGHATVPSGVNAAVPFVPAAVTECVCVAKAEPVNTCAVTTKAGAVALQAVVDPVPAAMLVAAQLPDVADAPLVPAGVPPDVAPLVTEEPVNVWAGTVPAEPVNAGTFTG